MSSLYHKILKIAINVNAQILFRGHMKKTAVIRSRSVNNSVLTLRYKFIIVDQDRYKKTRLSIPKITIKGFCNKMSADMIG